MLRPELPNVYSAGVVNADVSNQWPRERAPDESHEFGRGSELLGETKTQVGKAGMNGLLFLPLTGLLYAHPQDHLEPVSAYPFRVLGDREVSGPLQGDNQVPFVSGIADYESRNGRHVDPDVSITLWGNGSPDGPLP